MLLGNVGINGQPDETQGRSKRSKSSR